MDSFSHWLAGGWFGKKRVRGWLAALGDDVVEVEVEGQVARFLSTHLEDLSATQPSGALRLLGGFDQYVLGPGTADPHVVPASRRRAVSRTAGWISPVVVHRGVVTGTWELEPPAVKVTWFGEPGQPPRLAVREEVERLAVIVDQPLELIIDVG